MPNGGSDNCMRCLHNRAVQKFGQGSLAMPTHESGQRGAYFDLAYCEFHDVNLTHSAWTYCRHNTSFFKEPETAKELLADQPVLTEGQLGAIWASGLGDYPKIPWHGKAEPKVYVSCVCTVCENKTDKGIIVMHDGEEVGFCSNDHYIDWWKTKHDDPDILSDKYGLPYRGDYIKREIQKQKRQKYMRGFTIPQVILAIVFVVIVGIFLSNI